MICSPRRPCCWFGGGAACADRRGLVAVARLLLVLGCLAGVAAALLALPGGTTPLPLPTRLAGEAVTFRLRPDAALADGFRAGPGDPRLLAREPSAARRTADGCSARR